MRIEFINEFQVTGNQSKEINVLLQSSFPDVDYQGRDYYKLKPHSRFLAYESDKIIGHLAVDYRVMNLEDEPIQVLGVISLCVDSDYRNKKIGTQLLTAFETLAKKYPEKIDFLFLVADVIGLYGKMEYIQADISTTWLKIHQHKNYGVGTEKIDDAFFMYKSISGKPWKNGHLDLLGFMY